MMPWTTRLKFVISTALALTLIASAQGIAEEPLPGQKRQEGSEKSADSPDAAEPNQIDPTPEPEPSPNAEPEAPNKQEQPAPVESSGPVDGTVPTETDASSGEGLISTVQVPLPIDPPPVDPLPDTRVVFGMGLEIQGHRISDCNGWNEVIVGRPYTITTGISTSGSVRLHAYRHWNGNLEEEQVTDAILEGGTARWTFTAQHAGEYVFRADFAGNDVALPTESSIVHVRFVALNWTVAPDGGVILHVPWFRQQYSLSCESGSLRSALAYHGVDTGGDLPILQRIGIDSKRRRRGRWGDPETHFVGRYNGRMMRTGYGVHATPIARVATSYRPCTPAIEIRNAHYAQIAGYVNDGFPVEVWGAQRGGRSARRVTWRTWNGKIITAFEVEHTWLVVGFLGPPSSPTHFVIHDPSRTKRGGGNKVMSLAQFQGFTKYFATDTTSRVVVIR